MEGVSMTSVNALWKEFRDFAFKGSLIDLAIAFVLGAAFALLVQSAVNNLLMPLVGGVLSDKSFANLTFDFLGATVMWGQFLTDLIYFLIVAWVLFLIIKAINRMKSPAPGVPSSKDCPFCYSSIAIQASRCPNCTSQLS